MPKSRPRSACNSIALAVTTATDGAAALALERALVEDGHGLRRRLPALHACEVPADIALRATAGAEYAGWVGESTKRERGRRA